MKKGAPANFKVCPACSARNKAKWEYCVSCGESLQDVALGAPAPKVAAVEEPGSEIPWRSLIGTVLSIGIAAAVFVSFRQPPLVVDPAAWVMPTTPPSPPPPPPTKPHKVVEGQEEFEKGRQLLAAGDVKGALPLLAQAVQYQPENGLFQHTYAEALWQSGGKEAAAAAIEHYRLAADLLPDLTVYKLDLAKALKENGQRPAAARVLEDLLVRESQNTEALHELSRIRAADGEYAKAVPLLRQVLAQRPTDAVVQQELGVALDKTGDLTGAIAAYRAVITLTPAAALTRWLLADALMRKDEVSEAVNVMKQGLAQQPSSPLLHRGLGSVLERAGQIPEAIAEYRAYVKMAPNAPDARELADRATALEANLPPASS